MARCRTKYRRGGGGSIINSNTAAASVLTLSPTGGSTTFSGSIMGGGALGTISLVMSGSGTQVLAGSLLGPGSLTVNAGELILSGSDSYTGGTTVNAGTLVLASSTALADGTSLTVGAGGTLIFDPSLGGAGGGVDDFARAGTGNAAAARCRRHRPAGLRLAKAAGSRDADCEIHNLKTDLSRGHGVNKRVSHCTSRFVRYVLPRFARRT